MGLLDSFKPKPAGDQLKENKRSLDRAIRDLDRERQRIEQTEKKTVVEMKKLAKAGQQEACKMMAKDIVRHRNYVTKCYKMRAQLSSCSMQLQTLKSQHAMSKAMSNVTRTMAIMNRQMNLPAIQKMMMEFQKQNQMNEMKQEMMEDVMDDAMGEEGEEEETEEMLDKVMAEIGVSFSETLASAPISKRQVAKEEDVADDALQARLESLKKA